MTKLSSFFHFSFQKITVTVFLPLIWLIAAGCDFGPPKDSVSGTIHLDPQIRNQARSAKTVFIVLAPEDGGPPLAMQRLIRPKFPLNYVLTKDDMVAQGRPFSGRVKVKVQLDGDGRLESFARGDFKGEVSQAIPIGARDVDVVVNQVGTGEPPKVVKKPSPSQPPMMAQAAPPSNQSPLPPNGPVISGTIQVAPALAAKAVGKPVVYILARGANGGPLLAVGRIPNPQFPTPFTLSLAEAHGSQQGRQITEGGVIVAVRLDSDGSAGPLAPGDMVGKSSGVVPVGAKDVVITVDREITAGSSPAPRQAPPSQVPAPQQMPPPQVRAPEAKQESGGKTITGKIVVAPALAQKAVGKPVLFIIARSANPGPPLAVVRIPNPTFPYAFTLSQANVMMQGMPFEGNVRISARLDSDGAAGPASAGDIEGGTSGTVPVGSKDVVITLDRER